MRPGGAAGSVRDEKEIETVKNELPIRYNLRRFSNTADFPFMIYRSSFLYGGMV